jgi:arylsulfatase A-like enzyme
MRTVFVMFDSLNRHMLGPYGGTAIPTPNFDRLARHTATFDRHYVGSMPCMPARRDLQTGRLSFLHRSWGPLEPFDNSVPEILAKSGVYSHLITDHFHYFEDGGATYHTRYDSYEFIRGQEGDRWQAVVEPDWQRLKDTIHPSQFSTAPRSYFRQNIVNREFIREEADFPAVQCFAKGIDFLERNRRSDGWLLQIETFDPHEPFTAPERFKQAFKTGWNGPVRDWPRYGRVEEPIEEGDELRANYAALVALCDAQLGRVLDYFDAHDLWKDTALIVSTDHGFLLGEHDFWAKNRMTMYEELVHIPLFIHDPRRPGHAGERRQGLTQCIDIAATLLDLFDAARPPEMEGRSVLRLIDDADGQIREAALFGYFGGAVNVTDGRYTYHRYPADIKTQEIYQYTVMPTHIFSPFSTEELASASLAAPFPFSKGVPLLKIPVIERSPIQSNYGPGALLESETRLYDLETDPRQQNPLRDSPEEARLIRLMQGLMAANHGPPEAFDRLGLERPA